MRCEKKIKDNLAEAPKFCGNCAELAYNKNWNATDHSFNGLPQWKVDSSVVVQVHCFVHRTEQDNTHATFHGKFTR